MFFIETLCIVHRRTYIILKKQSVKCSYLVNICTAL